VKRIIYVSHDQLNARYGALKGTNPKEDLIVLVESKRMLTPEFGSKVRLYFLLSSAAHFVKSLQADGYTVIYQKSSTTVDGLNEVLKKYPNLPIIAATPSSFRLKQSLSDFGVTFIENDFFDNHFAQFGPYEDAMTVDNWALHHSLLSPYINNGLLHPSEVLEAAIKRFEKGDIPIASAEGFIRQIIGWREYVNGMYWYLGQDYKELNHLNAKVKLLPLFEDSSKTKMNCIKSNLEDIAQRGWVHHIPRLMLLSNLALITGTNPQEFLAWMRRVFIDATDWVMVPNVIGMGVHADNGVMMTKPYAAGGAYISKMSNYCKGCVYDPKLRTGENACPFTTLYWDFLDRNHEEFAGNHRMAQQLFGIKRLKDMPEVRKRAQEVLAGLSKGLI